MLAQAQANYGSASANVNYAVVQAPISGIVGQLPLKKGSLVGPSDPTPLTTVADISSVYAYFSMNEKEYFQFLNNTEGKSLNEKIKNLPEDRKSTRLNSSHVRISYAVFCLKKKT